MYKKGGLRPPCKRIHIILCVKIVFSLTIVNLIFYEFLGSQNCGIRHALIRSGYFDLLLILMNLLQSIGMTGKFFQLIMQFFLKSNIDLIGSLADNGNLLIQITCFCLQHIQVFSLHHIAGVGTNFSD